VLASLALTLGGFLTFALLVVNVLREVLPFMRSGQLGPIRAGHRPG